MSDTPSFFSVERDAELINEFCDKFRPALWKLMRNTSRTTEDGQTLEIHTLVLLSWAKSVGQSLGYIDSDGDISSFVDLFKLGLEEGRDNSKRERGMLQ